MKGKNNTMKGKNNTMKGKNNVSGFQRTKRRATGLVFGCLGLLLWGCGNNESGDGSLTVLLDTGGGIFAGLVPGDSAMNIRDGWSVSVEDYIVTVGDIDIHLSTDESVESKAEEVYVVDLADIPNNGLPLWTLTGLVEGRWEFNYSTPGAADGSTRHETVAQADYDEMVANDWTYLIRGTVIKADGESCPPKDNANLAIPAGKTPNGNMSGGNPCYDAPRIDFVVGATAETAYGPCEIDEVSGVAITNGGAQTVAASVHGDHIFFNGFPEGDEGGGRRLAQWLADCDLNLDGTVTKEELEAVTVDELPEIDNRYQLGGSPIEIGTMYDFWIGQIKTQGHFQGEGACPIDGVAHEHGHDDEHDDDHDDHDDE